MPMELLKNRQLADRHNRAAIRTWMSGIGPSRSEITAERAPHQASHDARAAYAHAHTSARMVAKTLSRGSARQAQYARVLRLQRECPIHRDRGTVPCLAGSIVTS